MTDRINLEDWLMSEEGAYATGTGAGDPSTGSSTSDPNAPGANPAGGDPNIANQAPDDSMGAPPEDADFSSDPKHPDMPEEKKHLDFEQWKSGIPVVAMNKETDNRVELIIEKIKNYPVANKTPLETLEFLSKIQKEINEYN